MDQREFFNRLSRLESESRINIEAQEKTLRSLAGLRADLANYIADQEIATPAPRVASAGIVEAPVYTVNVDG